MQRENKIIKRGTEVRIYLNKPNDFIYDIDDIILLFDTTTKKIQVSNDLIPEFIKNNMVKFYKGDMKKFVKFLEENLELFFKGDVPDVKEEEFEEEQIKEDSIDQNEKMCEEVVRRPYELPTDYVFPTNTKCTLNLAFEATRKNIFMICCKSISLQVKCNRCEKSNKVENAINCKGCTQNLSITYVPTFNQDFFGFLSLSNCQFISVNPSNYQFTCDSCGKPYETPELGIKTPFVLKCYDCNKEMRLEILKITHISKKQAVIKIGSELPEKGACKHYRKSFRWFRFPCCGSLYPCDICHDLEQNHDHELANKMICGLCSKEQSVDKKCDCGMKLKKTTAFWEGGKGNRNKETMSRRDSKKYKK